MEPFAPLGNVDLSTVSAVCIGTGRFLRAVLVPALSEIGWLSVRGAYARVSGGREIQLTLDHPRPTVERRTRTAAGGREPERRKPMVLAVVRGHAIAIRPKSA